MAGFLGVDELFKGRHFDREVIVLCVRWYLRFKPQLLTRSGDDGGASPASLAHTTIMRWVHYTPEFERRWNRFARPVGSSWRVDETYVKIREEAPEAGGRQQQNQDFSAGEERCWLRQASSWYIKSQIAISRHASAIDGGYEIPPQQGGDENRRRAAGGNEGACARRSI